MIGSWTAPLAGGSTGEELLVSFDSKRACRILVLPALFDEANKLRRFTIETMRALDQHGIDSFLPDVPGQNESVARLEIQTLASWRETAQAAADAMRATHVLSIRAGALLAPSDLPGWQYAPHTGTKQLRGMIRARTIAAREAGRDETSEALYQSGRESGLELAGWPIGATMFTELEQASEISPGTQTVISQSELGGGGMWLRAEPGEAPAQSQALARLIDDSLRGAR